MASNFSKILLPVGLAGFISMVLLAVLALRGGGDSSSTQGEGVPCLETLATPVQDNAPINLTVHVGIDASESIIGFVQEGNSRFVTVIQKLDDLLREDNLKRTFDDKLDIKSLTVNYWRLGINKNADIAERKPLTATQFLDARSPRFYCFGQPEQYPCVTSSLHQILDIKEKENINSSDNLAPQAETSETPDESPAPPPRDDVLQILVTDLEPDNAAIGEMTSRISKILAKQKDYKVALVGIRSEFNGTLYSTVNPSQKLKYTATANPDEEGRPFYLFLLGPSSLVDAFVDRFQDRIGRDMAESMKLSYFQHQNPNPLLLDVSAQFGEDNDDCTYRDDRLNGDRLTTEQASQWLILGQEQNCDDKGGGYKTFTLKSVKSTPSLLLRGGNFTPDLFRSSEPFVTVSDVSLEQGTNAPYLNLSLKIEGDDAGADEQAVYITLKEKALDEIIWQDWSIPVTRPLEGTKTQQLADFVKSVRDALSKDQDALRFCLGYIKD